MDLFLSSDVLSHMGRRRVRRVIVKERLHWGTLTASSLAKMTLTLSAVRDR